MLQHNNPEKAQLNMTFEHAEEFFSQTQVLIIVSTSKGQTHKTNSLLPEGLGRTVKYIFMI